MGIVGVFLDREALARLLNLDLDGGLLVQYVTPGSPADQAGIRGGSVAAKILDQEILLGGDLIVEFNNQETCHSECLIREGNQLAGLDRIPIKFLRGGKVLRAVVDVSRTRHNLLEDHPSP